MKVKWNPFQFILTWFIILLIIALVMYFDSSYSIALSAASAGIIWIPYVLTALIKASFHYESKKEIYLYSGWGWVIYFVITGFLLINGIITEPKTKAPYFALDNETQEIFKELDKDKANIKSKRGNNTLECKKIRIGEKEICSPLIRDMVECYEEDNIKSRVDQFKVQGNTIHAYYVSDSLYKRIKNTTDYFVVSDCFKVFSVNKTQNLAVSTAQLDEIFKMTTKSYRKDLYNKSFDNFDKKYSFLTLDSPVLIEEYEPHPDIRTALILVKSNISGKESFSLMTLNQVVVKERLLFYSYHLIYNGKESIDFAKSKSDYYGLKLVNEN